MIRVDPVCNQQVDDETAPEHLEYDGRDYFFHSAECKKKFQEDPSKYVREAAA